MGTPWSKIAELTGIPRVVIKEALRVTLLPAKVTRVADDGSTAVVRALRDEAAL
jgi:hypothetical protein